jgi:hypothetical protein
MRTRKSDDYWPPRPGSWEEAVDPYEVQWSKQLAKTTRNDEQDIPVEVLTDHRPKYGMPVSVS